MQLKKGLGWKAFYDEDKEEYFCEYYRIQGYHLYEITKEMFDRLSKNMTESDVSSIAGDGRHLFMSVNDRCGPSYAIVFDDNYKTLCPWANVVHSGKVWHDEMTDASVVLFETEKNDKAHNRSKHNKLNNN